MRGVHDLRVVAVLRERHGQPRRVTRRIQRVQPAARDRVLGRVHARHGRQEIGAGHAVHALDIARERERDRVGAEPARGQGARLQHEDVLVHRHERVGNPGTSQPLARHRPRRRHVHALRPGIRLDGRDERRERGHAMVRRQRDDDARRVTELEERIEERPEEPVQPEHLIVVLLAVGSVPVPDRVGRRERDGEQVGTPHGRAQPVPLQPLERELQRDVVQERRAHDGRVQRHRVAWQQVREAVVAAEVLDRHAVGFGVGLLGEQGLPRLAGPAACESAVVELPHPRRQRVGVIGARGEAAGVRVPEDVTLGAPDRQDGAAVLA